MLISPSIQPFDQQRFAGTMAAGSQIPTPAGVSASSASDQAISTESAAPTSSQYAKTSGKTYVQESKSACNHDCTLAERNHP
jgi:hypothetical protein